MAEQTTVNLVYCSHMLYKDGGVIRAKNGYLLTDNNVLNLCDECLVAIHDAILSELVTSALKEVFEVKVGGALG